MRESIANAERRKQESLQRYFDFADERHQAQVSDSMKKMLLEHTVDYGQAEERSQTSLDALIATNTTGITYTKNTCALPHGIRQWFAPEGSTPKCMSVVAMLDRHFAD